MNGLLFGKLQNLDLLSVGISSAAIGLLGFISYYNNPKDQSSRIFFGMCLTAVLWSLFNYLSYQFNFAPTVLWLLRFAIFFAIWFSYYIFWFFYSFPYESKDFEVKRKNLMLPATVIVSLLNLTPFVFNSIAEFSAEGRVSKVNNGPGIAVFGSWVIFLIANGIYLLVKKVKTSQAVQKRQIVLVLAGISISSVLLIIFNYIFPAFLENPSFVILGAVFLFPFIAFTAYAVFKHRLLNVKVIATEIITFILAVVSFSEVILSKDLSVLAFRSTVFILLMTFGVLLIRSVRKEVQQRELLEVLSKQLAETNKQLKVLDQARSEFISIASHQLRTPPATVKWYLSSILGGDYGRLSKEVKNQLFKTQNTNNALISLIEDMLNVSRIERGTMEFLFEEVDLEPLTQMTVDQLIPMAQEKKLKLSYQKPTTPLPKIMADKEKIRQVINNLIDNAIKYTQKGEVAVKLFKSSQTVEFQVRDTGKGIAPEDEGKIFEKFSRGKDSSNHAPGLGLGLYVAKIVIEQHKGKIWVESPGQDLGSTFYFQLPIRNHLKASSVLDLKQQA